MLRPALTSTEAAALHGIVDELLPVTLRRAQDYARLGHVSPLTRRGPRVTARVVGTDEYRVAIHLESQAVSCSCPAHKPCKHIGAVAIVALQEAASAAYSAVAAGSEETYVLCVRLFDYGYVMLNGISPTGRVIPISRYNIRFLKPAHRKMVNSIVGYGPHIAELDMPFSDFADLLLEKLARDSDVKFYFDMAEQPTRCAGVVQARSEMHEVADPTDDAHYDKFGYRQVCFECSHTVIDPVTYEPYTFSFDLDHPMVRRGKSGEYFYVIAVPHDITPPPRPCYLDHIERMRGSAIRRKWEHAFETMATAGPKLMLSVMGVENKKNGRFSLEGRLEFAYAREWGDLRSNDAGSEIADGAKPIYGISVSRSRPGKKVAKEIVQHKTGVLIKRLGSAEQQLLWQRIPFKYTSVGKVRIAKKRYMDFFTQDVPAAKAAGLIVRIHDNILGLLQKPAAVSLAVKGSSGIDWFEGRIEVPGLDPGHLREVIKAYRQKEELVKLRNGRWLSVQGSGIADVLKSLDRLGITANADGTISKMSFAQLAGLEAEKQMVLRTEEGAATAQQKFRNFLQANPPDTVPSRTLTATLRHYQLEGFRFLLRLYEAKTGGILADDMGLGKTVQAIAVMDWIAGRTRANPRRNRTARAQFLVVCPLAALGVWESEIRKFAPQLSVYRWHGPGRSEKQAQGAQVILTTFATFSLDAQKLCQNEWEMAFIDEAQFVKNFRSRSARALRKLNVRSLVCLTGTPLENYLEDLWALFDLFFPGYLGTAQSFKDTYGGHLDLRDREALTQKIRPFMLRRRKADVLTELPEKTEMVVKVPMTPVQGKVYEAARIRALSTLGQKGSPLFDLLRHLTALRRIACHPYLEDEKADPFQSGKFEYLDSQLLELSIASAGVLVFSQYTSVLRVFKHLLKKRGIEPLYLDGKTSEKSRRELVTQFQNGGAKFFLISLKAGGTALTLTRADTVIHLDPWWNPAVENQATDRAHRIGQKKRVMVYKLISEGTVEEKVLTLQAQKRELFNDLIDDEPAEARRITREDIADILG
ncbi:MAG: hypothetical protein OHK0011_22790 [Turneriella sp.]